jgi:hypothetical protein
MNFPSTKRWTSPFVASVFSSDIFRSFCFLGAYCEINAQVVFNDGTTDADEVQGGPRKDVLIAVEAK